MLPQKYLQVFTAAVVKRSGICKATVEAVLPAVFDEIRYQLTEGPHQCVCIESFGTFTNKHVPEHEFLYHRGDKREIHTVPAKNVVKFAPTRNLRNEAEAGQFDPTRKSFVRHPDDPLIRKRRDLRYRPAKKYKRGEGSWGEPIKRQRTDTAATDLTDSTDND